MIRIIKLILVLACTLSLNVVASDSLSYSGRLVNADGSPVTGPVKLKFDLAYTDDLNNIICTHQVPSADLINGVFHAKLSFTCPDTTLAKVLESIPLNNTIAIRVTNESPSTPKVYSFQALNSVPYSIMSNFAKQLSLAGTASGQVLTWNGSAWTAADPVGTVDGVTTIVAEQGLTGTKVDETVTIGILDGGVTAQKLHPMGATTAGQVLKWNGSSWGPGADTDTGITAETDPLVRNFARTDIAGIVPPTCDVDQTLQYFSAMDSFVCADIVISDADLRSATVADAINDAEISVAPSQNAVFDALVLKQNTITTASEILMKSLKLTSDGSTWMGFKAPATAGNLLFTLPAGDGLANQVLKTDGSGNLGWATANTGTITGITTTAPLSGTGTSGSVNVSLSYDNSTIGLNASNALIVKDSGISNSHIAALAGIDWSKINKTGAVASDVGAVPTARTISTGTGLLGGGDLTANRTLSVDVGTTAGKIIQVDGTGKLPVIDGSQLTNLLWSQVSKTGSTNLIAGTGLNGGGDLSADRTFSVDVGTTAGKIVQVDGAGKLPAIDGSQLTNLGTNLGKWSNATGGIHYSTGNVGVGTTIPSEKIHTHADTGVLKSALRTSWTDTNSYGEWNAYEGSTFMGGITLMGSNVTNADWRNAFLMTAAKNDLGSLIFRTRTANAYQERMVIKNDGKVGIGTINPTGHLDIRGNMNGDLSAYLFNSNSTEANARSIFLFGQEMTGNYGFLHHTGDAYVNGTIPNLLPSQTVLSGPDSNGLLLASLYGALRFSTGSSPVYGTKMLIDTAGNVGIGTTTPQAALDIKGVLQLGVSSDVSIAPDIQFKAQGLVASESNMYLNVDSNNSALGDFVFGKGTSTSAAVPLMIIKNSGNVGIGTSTPSSKFVIASTTGSNVITIERPDGHFGLLKYSTGINRRWEMGVSSALETGSHVGSDFGLWSYGDDGSQNQIIYVKRSSGFVGIGKNSPSTKLNVDGAIASTSWVGAGCEDACSDVASGYAIMYSDGRGVSTVGWTTTSDIRLKENFQPLENNLDKILKIRGFNYNYKEQSADKKQIGVIAQEVQKVFPETISHNEDGFLSVDYPRLVAPVIEAIRELYQKHVLKNSNRIEKAERKIAAIESENAKIKAENALLKQRLDLIEKNLKMKESHSSDIR